MLVPIILNSIPTPGALLGTVGHRDLIANINSNLNTNSGFFNSERDIFASARQAFVTNILEPIKEVARVVKGTVMKLLKEDVITAMTTLEAFEYVPSKMELPILLYRPVRDLFEEGRVEGFGYNKEWLPEEDYFGRLIKNGYVDDALSKRSKDGDIIFRWRWKSTDPDLEIEEIDDIEQTRMYIDDILANTSYDPTNYPAVRG